MKDPGPASGYCKPWRDLRKPQKEFQMMNHNFGWMGGQFSIWAVLAVLVVVVVLFNKLFRHK
jgi:hypothetical protein